MDRQPAAAAFGLSTAAPGDGSDADALVVAAMFPSAGTGGNGVPDVDADARYLAEGWVAYSSSSDAQPGAMRIDRVVVDGRPAARVHFVVAHGSGRSEFVTGVVLREPSGAVALVGSTNDPAYSSTIDRTLESLCVGPPAPASGVTTTTPRTTPKARTRCATFSFAAESGSIAYHAPTAETALSAWLEGQFEQEIYGPVSFARSGELPKSGQGARYDLTQGGQVLGDVEIRHDAEGEFVFSSRTCEKWEPIAPTDPATPGTASKR